MSPLQRFWHRLLDLPGHLSPKERYSLLTLLCLILILGGVKISRLIGHRLVVIPAEGGTVVEGLVGQPKLLSVLSASEVTDKTVLGPIYSGLTRTNAAGETEPDLAEQWQIEDDGKTYVFTLREGLTWHDGTPLTTSDVAETIGRAVDDQTKSPYQKDWLGVNVEVVDPITINFHLSEPAAGFLSATSLPITPLHIPVTDIQKNLVGSGPYRYQESIIENGAIKEIILVRNEAWYGDRPYLDRLSFRFYKDEVALNEAYRKKQLDSVVLTATQELPGQHFDLATSRVRTVFFNTERDLLKDVANRRRILNNEAFDQEITLKLITHNGLATSAPLLARLALWAQSKVRVEVVSLDSVALLAAIDSHDYDLLFVDVDLRADFDRFPLWHSSQKDGGLNFSRLNDAALDRLLEQAHMTPDLGERKKLTQQVEDALTGLAVTQTLEPVHLHWFVQDSVRGLPSLSQIVESTDRFFSLNRWYVKTSLSDQSETDTVDTASE